MATTYMSHTQKTSDQEKNNSSRQEHKLTMKLSNAIIAGFCILAGGILIGRNADTLMSQFGPYLGGSFSSESTDWSQLNEVYAKLKSNYDGEINPEQVIEYAKRGIAASVEDPYTVYMSPEEASDFQKSLHGDVGSGIGVVIAKRENYIRIVRTLPDNPASRAGLLAGDIIYKVNDEVVYDLESDEIANKLRGKSGESVKLTVVRENQELDFELVRETINNVSAYVDYSGETAIITVTRFDTDTGDIVKKFTDDFDEKGIKKVILDLRDNGGGYVSAAKDLLSLWIDSKSVLIQKSVKMPEEITYAAHGQAKLANMPTVVLVNGSTASASEIVAGALKDYEKATIIGEKTYGKGVVQSLVNLSNGTLLKVTTAHWYTPNGNTINKTGIEPDQEIIRSYEDINTNKDPQLDAALAF